jgi:hypothetical protein
MEFLSQLLPADAKVSVGKLPVETGMILDRIIANDGDLLDSVGVVTVASLCQALKDGDLARLSDYPSDIPRTELIQFVRDLEKGKLVKLAKAIKELSNNLEGDEEVKLFDKTKSVTDWVRFVLAKQD